MSRLALQTEIGIVMRYPYLSSLNPMPHPGEARYQRDYRRLLELCGLGCGIGVLGAVAAFVLQAAISLVTNVFFYGQLSLASVSPANNHLGLLVLFIPPLWQPSFWQSNSCSLNSASARCCRSRWPARRQQRCAG